MSHKKFGPDRFSRFDVYWIQTNKQRDTQTDKPNLYIDNVHIIIKLNCEISLTFSENQHWVKKFENDEILGCICCIIRVGPTLH